MQEKERHITDVLKLVLEAGCDNNGRPLYPLRQAVCDHGISYQSLTRCYHGVLGHSPSHEQQMALCISQEEILVAWIKEVSYRGIPWDREIVRKKASIIAKRGLSIAWVYRFLKRHPDLKSRWTTSLGACQAGALNKTTVSSFFDILKDVIERYKIEPKHIYNMDEKGIQMGVGGLVRTIEDKDQKMPQSKVDGNKEMVMIIECVCADGTALDPMAIFKGTRINATWGRNNDCNTAIAVLPNGWMDTELWTGW